MKELYMNHFADHYGLDENSCMIILPLERALIESQLKVKECIFFPPDFLDLNKAVFVEPFSTTIRGNATFITGFKSSVFYRLPGVAFAYKLDWNAFFKDYSHKDDAMLIKQFSHKADRALDIVRFECCNISRTGDLPAKAGVFNSAGFSGALLYNPYDNEAFRIGAKISTYLIADGMGLDFPNEISCAYDDSKGIGPIIKQALLLYTEVLEASNDTSKFYRAMSLLEFLASPNETQIFKEVKSQIICHLAKDKKSYHTLSDRFQELSGKKNMNNEEVGYRTLIVHQGKRIEDILNEAEIKELFLELDNYIKLIISDMFLYKDKSWDEFSNYRIRLKQKLKVM